MSVAVASEAHDPAARYFAEVERICPKHPWLTPLGGAILAGIDLAVAHDSRGFAKALGIEHALVLREVQTLVDLERLIVTQRDERTHRCRYARAGREAVNDPV